MKKIVLSIVAAVALVSTSLLADPVLVAWDANPVDEQVQSYDVQLAVNAGSFSTVTNVPGTSVTLELAQGAEYRVQIVANNLTGSSVPSTAASTGVAPTKPATPVLTVNP